MRNMARKYHLKRVLEQFFHIFTSTVSVVAYIVIFVRDFRASAPKYVCFNSISTEKHKWKLYSRTYFGKNHISIMEKERI